MTFKMVGQERPWTIAGPDGPVSVIGVVFEGDEAILDNGALHARSHRETGVRFSEDANAKGRGERLISVWVSFRGAMADRFIGLTTAEAWVDRASATGYKRPIDHVNRMSAAVRGQIDASGLSTAQRQSVVQLLSAFSPKAWDASGELRAALV